MIAAAEPVLSDAFDARMRAFFRDRDVDLDAQAIVFALFRAETDVFALMERVALRPHGLTHAGFVLLMSLWTGGPMETRRLADVLGVSRPAVVSAVNTLEAKGWVCRLRSDEDRRLVTLKLTPSGRRTVERAQRATHVYERRLADEFTKGEQQALAELLRKLDRAARMVGSESTK
jgi:DNA-binding MarR family transcriptional regulator